MTTRAKLWRYWPVLGLAAGSWVLLAPRQEHWATARLGPATAASVDASNPVGADAAPPLIAAEPTAAPPVHQRRADRLARLVDDLHRGLSPADLDDSLTAWIAGLRSGEVPAALAALQTAGLPEELRADLSARLVRRWAQDDAASATAWVEALGTGPGRELAWENVALSRADSDLPDASAWAQELPEGPERARAVLAIANEAVRTDPALALQMAAQAPAGPATDELIARAAMEYALQNQAGAVEWARQIPDPGLRTQVMAGIAVAWSQGDPADAAAFATRALPPGRVQDDAVAGIAQRWAQVDPAAAATWAGQLPAGELQQAAVENVAALHSP